jgi:hypothetical protein
MNCSLCIANFKALLLTGFITQEKAKTQQQQHPHKNKNKQQKTQSR